VETRDASGVYSGYTAFGYRRWMKSESELFRREKRPRKKGKCRKKISKKQAKELTALSRMPDHKIDLSDMPEVRDWRNAVVGNFYRPIKTPVTIRVDADVLAWLKR
jgi:uncharacterized protein (DUF4415 family)